MKDTITTVPNPWQVMWREIKSDIFALMALIISLTIIIVSFVWATTFDIGMVNRIDLLNMNRPPGGDFVLGTDVGGRNMLHMLVIGARNSFIIAFSVSLMAAFIGLLVGLFSGFYGGKVDNVIMRVLDFLGMLPVLMLIIVIISLIPNYSPVTFALVMTFFSWGIMARNIRAKSLQQGTLDYISASKTLGTPNIVIIFREMLPNIISFVVVNITLLTAFNMGLETGLSFLGFGLPAAYPSLGVLISHAANPVVFQDRSWQWLPAALLVLTMCLCINYVGQALNRAADAKRRRV